MLTETETGALTRTALVARLEATGWRLIGQGVFSGVYASGAQDVLRIDHATPRGFPAGHVDGWTDYARFCIRQGGKPHANRHFPRIAWVTKTTDGRRVARIEQLVPMTGETMNAFRALKRAIGQGEPAPTREMRKAINRFRHNFDAPGRFYRLDLHPGNCMARVDGTLVITDPVAGRPRP